jgi:cob(I)alamin adenosyltransferase
MAERRLGLVRNSVIRFARIYSSSNKTNQNLASINKELTSLQTSLATSHKIELQKIRNQILLPVMDSIPKLMDKLITTANAL